MKKRNGKNIICNACSKEFYVPAYRIETARFCSLFCQNHKQHDKYIFNCQACGKHCETSPSRRNYKKKFCSLECREYQAKNDKERRKQIRISNKLKRGNIKSRDLRKFISQFKELKCEICGYQEYDFCLDMHHINKDPTDNRIENIAVLCCMCHKKLHKGIVNL